MPRIVAASLALMLAGATSHAHAGEDTETETETKTETKPEPSVLATATAVVPGLVLHGFGHLIAGEEKTAYRLLALEGIGFGLMAISAATIGLSGGSRYGNELTIPTLVTGSGIFLNTALADIYGSASGGRTSRFQPAPDVSAALGYGYIKDPQFAYAHFAVAQATLKFDAFSTTPSLWTALNADNQRARLPLHYRILDNNEGDFVQANTALTYHRYGDDAFSCLIGELSAEARINLSRIGPSLSGAFTTLRIGYALHRTDYDLSGTPADTIGLLLARYSYGLYLPYGGELEGYYEHRRDGFTAGLSPSSRNGSGFLGHFGLTLRQPVTDWLALRAQTEIGAAWLSTAGIEIRK